MGHKYLSEEEIIDIDPASEYEVGENDDKS